MVDANRGPEVTDQGILSVFASADDQRLRTREAAGELPIDEELLLDRIEDLSERDLLRRDEDAVGDTWHLTPDGEDEVTVPEEAVESEIEAQATKVTGVESTTRDEETPETPPPDPQEDPLAPEHGPVPDAIELFDPPGDVEATEPRRDALRLAYDYLRTSGRADRADFESDVFPDASGGYEEPSQWWTEVVRPGLETLPGVESADGGEEWRFTDAEEESTKS